MLQEQRIAFQNVDKRIQEMTMLYKKVAFKFVKAGDIDNKSIGSILETKEASSPSSARRSYLTNLQEGNNRTVEFSEWPNITDIAVTTDNKVFFCNFIMIVNFGKIYVYKLNQDNLAYNTAFSLPREPYGISILTGTDKAVITLPYASYVQCINTKYLKLDKTIEVGKGCYGITTSEYFVAVGKTDEIRILKQNGEIIKTIVLSDRVFCNVCSLLYNLHDGSIIYRKSGQVRGIQLDGTVLYQYKVSRGSGLVVDAQGNVYVSEENKSEIQGLLPYGRFVDVVLTGEDDIAIRYNV
ncbi:unnamed protein product [Mytilus coruscus]|uniref:Uncharacterized protein n=1 Tax=Mytilus coruscus TaxID=42192 RepID=A0A6J8AAP2_MYTCO|nr:unnamed protein product [Mytilus coruscus]